MNSETLVNKDFIRSNLTVDDPWCSSHAAVDGGEELGAGVIYYGLAYALKSKICVCLGSGGGFVPRMMRQAQRDLNIEESRTILVDGGVHVDQARKDIWGSPSWLPEESTFRKNYPDVEIVLKLTKDAFHDFFVPSDINIDFLHIDADHHYDGVKLDWDLFSPLVSADGVITLHDTVNHREPCGVPRLLDEIRQGGGYDLVNLPIRYGTAILRKRPVEDPASAR